MTKPLPGDPAPDFVLTTSHGQTVSLSDYRGRRIVVFFFPSAMSPGCTTEACDFRDSLHSFALAGVDVLGISPDPVERLAEFVALESLTFPLASDPEREVIDSWGALGEKVKDGVTVMGVVRSSFVVAADGRLEHVFRNVSADGHVAELREILKVE